MAADPEKTVTVKLNDKGEFEIVATQTETYVEKPVIVSVTRREEGKPDEDILPMLRVGPVVWNPPRADPATAPGIGVKETATVVLNAGGPVPGSYVVKVNCSGTKFPVFITAPLNGVAKASLKIKDLS